MPKSQIQRSGPDLHRRPDSGCEGHAVFDWDGDGQWHPSLRPSSARGSGCAAEGDLGNTLCQGILVHRATQCGFRDSSLRFSSRWCKMLVSCSYGPHFCPRARWCGPVFNAILLNLRGSVCSSSQPGMASRMSMRSWSTTDFIA